MSVDELLKQDVKFELISYGNETYQITVEDDEKYSHKMDSSLVDLQKTINTIPIPTGMPRP